MFSWSSNEDEDIIFITDKCCLGCGIGVSSAGFTLSSRQCSWPKPVNLGPAPINLVWWRNQGVDWTEADLLYLLEEGWSYKECAPHERMSGEQYGSPSVSAPTEIKHRRNSPWFTEELFPVSPAFPFALLQLLGWRQRLPKSWSPLFCCQVHQLGGCFCWPADPFYHSSSQSITSQGEVTMWHFWLWIPSKEGGCHSQSEGQRFYKRESFFGPLFFFYLPAWNVNLGPRGAVAILLWESNSFKDGRGPPAENVEQSWKAHDYML